MFEMKAPNGETLIARDEQQKEVMVRAGFVEVAETKKSKSK